MPGKRPSANIDDIHAHRMKSDSLAQFPHFLGIKIGKTGANQDAVRPVAFEFFFKFSPAFARAQPGNPDDLIS